MGKAVLAEVIEMKPTKAVYVTRLTDGYNRIYRDVLALGATLVEARNSLTIAEFKRMIEDDLPFGVRTAYSYIREWTIAQTEDVQPVARLADGYSVRAEIDKLTDDELTKGLSAGKLFQGVTRSKVIDYRKEIRSQAVHRPISLQVAPPARPKGHAATSYSELVWMLIEWRNVRGMSQLALDERCGWGEGQTSKYEIPHMDDGRIAPWEKIGEWMQGLQIGITVVPQ